MQESQMEEEDEDSDDDDDDEDDDHKETVNGQFLITEHRIATSRLYKQIFLCIAANSL